MNTLKVGDKVRATNLFPPMALERLLFNRVPEDSRIYTVRKTGLLNGRPAIWLSGIYGYPSGGCSEPGFWACDFRLVWKAPEHFEPLTSPMAVTVPVTMPARQAEYLSGTELFPQVESMFYTDHGTKLDQVFKRWHKRSNATGISIPCQVAQAGINRDLLKGVSSVQVLVPLSHTGKDDVERIAHALGITPEMWLQGILANLAAKIISRRALYSAELDKRSVPRRETEK